jgi:hypothetical protein
MKKWIFFFLAMCLVLVLPTTAMANDRAGPNKEVQISMSSQMNETEYYTPNCNTKDVTKSGTLIVATTDAKENASIPRTAEVPLINTSLQIQTDESSLTNIMAQPSIARDDGTFMTVILDGGAQKTKFPSSNVSAMEYIIAAANVRILGWLRI